MAAPIKNGSEKSIRSISRVSASVCVFVKASFTIIALVENKMDPAKAMINPAVVIVDVIFVVPISTASPSSFQITFI